MSSELVSQDQTTALMELTVGDVQQQVVKVQELMKAVMKKGEHYGVIPGTNGKNTLLKAGAEKLGFTFRLAPRYDVKRVDLEGGHREYEVGCTLTHQVTEAFVGQGVGVCSTMEKKYHYVWKGEGPDRHREENPDIADKHNTVLKMAKKRAHVDAMITACAASDIFAQDLEDMPVDTTEPTPAPKLPEALSVNMRGAIVNWQAKAGEHLAANKEMTLQQRAYLVELTIHAVEGYYRETRSPDAYMEKVILRVANGHAKEQKPDAGNDSGEGNDQAVKEVEQEEVAETPQDAKSAIKHALEGPADGVVLECKKCRQTIDARATRCPHCQAAWGGDTLAASYAKSAQAAKSAEKGELVDGMEDDKPIY